MSAQLYTQEQLDIELLKQQSGTTTQTLNRIETELNAMDKKIDSNFKWLLSLLISELAASLGLMAHGFHWL
jgi:hypothetical protein